MPTWAAPDILSGVRVGTTLNKAMPADAYCRMRSTGIFAISSTSAAAKPKRSEASTGSSRAHSRARIK